VRAHVDAGADGIVLEVQDTGIGIHPDDEKHIFEPFFTTKLDGKGVGLGLAVVYGIVTRHGGRIEVQSQRGTGTTFRMHLPSVPPVVQTEKESSHAASNNRQG
jgi:signal transduction histidine kinase